MAVAMTILKNNAAAAAGGGENPNKVRRESIALRQHSKAKLFDEERRKAKGPKKIFKEAMAFFNSMGFQTVFYCVFVIIFQLLANSVRNPREYYLHKAIDDRLVENYFDSSHNKLMDVRRVADIWEVAAVWSRSGV